MKMERTLRGKTTSEENAVPAGTSKQCTILRQMVSLVVPANYRM